jgi:hypothetical protein
MRFLAPVLIAASVAACGGGGGGNSTPPPPPPLSGQIVKGPVAGATVSLYSMNVDGTRTLLGATMSDVSGSYSFNIALAMNTVVLVEASNGTYLDEISASRVPLGSMLRGAAVVSSTAQRLSVSPFSEAAVREIDSAVPKNWAAANVNAVNANFSGTLGVSDLLQLTTADLSSDNAAANASDDDFFLTIQLGGFTGLLHGLSLPLDQGLEALRTMLADPFDDRYNPAWIRGTVDFIDTTGLSAEPSADPFDPNPVPSKRELKAAVLLLGSGGSSDAALAAALPTGQATGSATAPMPDDAFQIVSDPNFIIGSPVGTIFNSRGALAAYQVGAGIDRYHYIYSASVGELYGDGDVGVGRWHGGVVFDSTDGRAMETATNPQILTATNGESYAVAIPATGLPSCGARLLQLVASTKPTQSGTLETKVVTGLTADSKVGIQYSGTTAFIGVDLGLQLSDNTMVRATTIGGSAAPWASGASLAADKSFGVAFFPASPPALLTSATVSVNGILAGSGGRKAGVKIRIQGPTFDAETIAAAFSAPDMPPDGSGCAVAVTGDGSAAVPAPANGIYAAFADTFTEATLFFGVAISTTFRSTGAVLTAGLDPTAPQLSIPPDTPMFELAGNADAVIGRAKGPFTFRGVNHNQSLPFAAARAPGVFPTSGTKHYVLVASTAAIATAGSGANFFEAAPGQVTSATLDINFGENPIGTPNPFAGTARISIQGTVAGLNFSAGSDPNGTPVDMVYGPSTGYFGGIGAVTGANAEFAVIKYQSSIGTAPIQGAVLLQAQ